MLRILRDGDQSQFGDHYPEMNSSDSSASEVLESRLRRHVDTLADLIGPRHVGRPKAYAAAAEYVRRELASAGESVAFETYSPLGGEASNLILERRGESRSEEIVLLGAHYDTVPETPGADDNASAVAVLLEAARLVRGIPAPRTIRFVAFACEEPPHFQCEDMGSQVHARGCRQRGERIAAMICLEMVG